MEAKQGIGIQDLLRWNDEYSCLVSLIDYQHHGILAFITSWYNEVISTKGRIPQIVQFMNDKFKYLDRYSRSHLRFEEEMMALLVQDYKFPQDQYEKHMGTHQRFIKDFMGSMSDQLSLINSQSNKSMVDSLAGDAAIDLLNKLLLHASSSELLC